MGKYIDKNLSRNEQIIVKAKFSIFGGLIGIFINELAVTNKNVVGKAGFIRKKTMSSPLDKVQNISVSKGLFGSIFGYGKVRIDTTSGTYCFRAVKKPDQFKNAVLNQIEAYEQDKVKRQATEMAQAMSAAMNTAKTN